jgi:hypothetical protein
MPIPQFVEIMTIYPQRCVISGAPNALGQEPALDLGVEIEGHGRLYVSASSMEYLATLFGYIKLEEAEENALIIGRTVDALLLENEALKDSVARIPQAVERMLNGLSTLTGDVVADLLRAADPAADSGTDDLPAPESEADEPAGPEAASEPPVTDRPIARRKGRDGVQRDSTLAS